MAAIKHYIETVAGVTRHMVLRLANQDGTPATAADYAIYGAARQGDRIHPFGAAPMDPSSVRLSIPPLDASNYAYDLYAKHTATGIEHALLCGSIRVADRVASMPPADQGGEHIEASISSDLTAITVTVQIVPVITAATWEAIEASISTADSLLEKASNLLPAARQEIDTATGTAKQNITEHATSETATAKKEINQTAGQAAADTADIIAASGEAATSAALESISTAEATAINQAVNNGINAIGQSITAGTGTISAATADGKSSIDSYVLTTQADLALKSQANIWGGVNTFNAPVVLNDSATLASSNAFGADIFARRYRINNLIDSCILAERLAPRDITYGTDWWWQASDSSTQRYSISGQYAMVAKPSAVGAWRSSYLVTSRYFTAVERAKPSESHGERVTRIGIFAIRPRINARSGEMPNVSSAAVQIGFMCFFTSHSDSYPFPVTRRPWDWPIFEPPHHGNWSQINGVDVCEAYGHDIPSICVCCGYGGGIRDADGIEYNARPCIRYKSPVSSAADVVAFYVSSDANDQHWFYTGIKSYIELADGSTIEFYGQFVGQRYSDLGCRAVPRDGKQTNLSIKSVALYPNVRPLEYYKGNVDISAPVHPIEDYLRDRKSYSIARPSKANYLGNRISIAYTPHSAERHPYDYRMYAPGDPLSYGAQITISRLAQNLMVTMPDDYVIDVDHWSRDWCVANGKTLEIPENTTGQDRYVSVWFYSPVNNNNADGTNTILEYGITQKG